MKIFVDMLFINMKVETTLIEVDKDTTLDCAKNKILETSYIYPEEQVWFCNNTPIKSNIIKWDTKERYSIIVNNKWYNFSIKTITNTIINVNYLTSRDLISTIKYHIYEKVKLPPKSYILMAKVKGKSSELIDTDPIGKYFLPNKSIINLIIKLNSGLK